MKHHSFISFAKNLAETLGRGEGVNITFGGQEAFTDGKRVNLPALPPGTVLTPYQERILTGYVDHESSHIRWTDFKAWEKRIKNHPQKKALHMLSNQFEDIRIENRQIENYPGVRPFLDDLAHHVDEAARAKHAQGKEPDIGALIYYHCYKNHRKVDTFISKQEMKDFPQWKPIMDVIDADLPRAQTTMQIIDLAEKVLKMLPPSAVQQLEKMFDGHSLRDQVGEEMAAEVNSANKKMEQPGGIPYDGDASSAAGLPRDKRSSDKAIRLRHSGEQWFPPDTLSNDKVFRPSNKDMAAYETTRTAVAPEISAAKKMLNLYLRSRNRRAWSRGLEKGKLDTTRLPGLLMTGEKRVMKEKRDSAIVNTSIVVLIDLSGSMSTSSTRTAAILISEALDGIKGVQLEILGFTDNGKSSHSYGYGYNTKPGVGRLYGLNLLIYKGFKQSYKEAKPHLGALKCTGSTPLACAYGYALERLMVRTEPRRLLWIISDGDPCLATGDSRHSDYVLMERLKNKADRIDIEVVGMYIGSTQSNLKDYVRRLVNINSSSQLPTALMDMVRGSVG